MKLLPAFHTISLVLLILTQQSAAQHTITIQHTYYTSYFDTILKVPIVAEYTQTREHRLMLALPGAIDRSTVASFTQDSLLPTKYQVATNTTYHDWNQAHPDTPYDKGHMVPFQAMAFNRVAAKETNKLNTNTNYQASYNNEHQWYRVEHIVLDSLCSKYGDIDVLTLCLFSTSHPKWANSVRVPDYYVKVALYMANGTKSGRAWIEPNVKSLDTSPASIEDTPANIKRIILQYYPNLQLNF